MTLEIYELNAHVLIDGESARVSYEVTWWDERSRKCEWVEPSEIKPKDAKRATLQFKPVA